MKRRGRWDDALVAAVLSAALTVLALREGATDIAVVLGVYTAGWLIVLGARFTRRNDP